MKYKQLKKRLLVEMIIVMLILALLGAGTYFVISKQEEFVANKRSKEGQVNSVTNETNGLREKFIRLQNNQEIYQTVMNLSDTDMLSNSAIIVDSKLREYEYDYNLEKWSLDSGALDKTLNAQKYKRKTSEIVNNPTTLDIVGLTDIDIQTLMQKVQASFPGAVSYTYLKLIRKSRLTDEALRSITKNGSFPLVNGEIKFNWFGISPVDPEEAKKQEAVRNKKRRRRRRRR